MGLLDWWKKRRRPSTQHEATQRPQPQAPAPAPVRIPPAPKPAPPPRRESSQARWLQPGQQAHIHGIQLPDGMIYVGQHLPTARGVGVDPALIDPSLPISLRAPRTDMLYWPSYSETTPAHRGAYLAWLSTGRQAPLAEFGYLFLFFYGLERRVLVDLAANPALASELPVIQAEVARLLARYGSENYSFQSYASSFLEVIELMLAGADTFADLPPPALTEQRWSVPLALRVGIGTRAAMGVPIPADWALAWAWFTPESSLRTPATRCTVELSRLFAVRYAETYPKGLPFRPGKTKIRWDYQPASRGIDNVPLSIGDVPDVFTLKAPGRKLAKLFESVTAELDPYSRWLGRNPGKAGSLASFALLPPEIIDDSIDSIRQLKEWANAHLERGDPARVPGAQIVALWASNPEAKLAKADAVSIAQLLGHLGVGIEPDVRFGGPPLSAHREIVLFRIPPGAPQTATPAYGAAMTLVHLAAAVAAADGHISRHEVEQLGTHVGSSLRLAPAEQNRLYAHLVWLSTVDIKLTGLTKRLETLSLPQRQSIGDVLVTIAAADGVISPEEVTTLIKIFRMLGLDPESVTSRLHTSLTSGRPAPAENPVTVRPAITQEVGYPIPPRQQPSQPGGFVLDHAAIARIQQETMAAASLLGEIFVDDQEPPHPPPADPPGAPGEVSTEPPIPGLDLAHSRLLRALSERTQWDVAEYEDLATRFDLMPDGAIDMINQAAFDAADEPVIEGDDALTINPYALQELLG